MLRGQFGGGEHGQCLAVNFPQQQPRGDKRVVRLAFDSRARRENHCLLDLLRLHAVVKIPECFVGEVARGTVRFDTATGGDQSAADALRIE